MTRRADRRQRGAALLVAVVAAACLALAMWAGGMNDTRGERERRNAVALAAAKEALIGYAVTKGNPPGSLPCPDLTNNSGTAAASCSATMIGRLPWKTIGLGDVRDADGECLWYALSPMFKNGVATLNANTAGSLTIKNASGNQIAGQVLAVIIAPGSALAGNDRTPAGNALCAGNAIAANYLDTAGGISNATGNRSGNAFTFVLADRSDGFNDQLAYVTAVDLFTVLQARVANEMRGDATNGLRRYFAAHANALPWAAASAAGAQQAGLAAGYVPYGDPDLLYPGSSWLNANGWFALASYRVTQPNQAKITLHGTDYAYTF